MLKRLKVGDTIPNSSRKLLKKYLDKKYEFERHSHTLKKDPDYIYPYRAITKYANEDLGGLWNYHTELVVSKVPPRAIDFKEIYRV